MKLLVGIAGAIVKDKKLLLTKRHPDMKQFPNFWTFPAGHLEETDKTMKDTVIRELKEEVNLDFIPKSKLGFYETTYENKRIFSLVFLGEWSGEIKRQEDEVSEVGWFTYEETKDLQIAFCYKEAIEDLHKLRLI
jgi:ADP-ribose pyrophosphatase YjhB (NUDIX family)